MYLAFEMGLQYLTFMERILENMKKPTLVGILNSASMNSKINVNNVDIFNESVPMNSGSMEH